MRKSSNLAGSATVKCPPRHPVIEFCNLSQQAFRFNEFTVEHKPERTAVGHNDVFVLEAFATDYSGSFMAESGQQLAATNNLPQLRRTEDQVLNPICLGSKQITGHSSFTFLILDR